MKKMDEMGISIKLRSESFGYKAAKVCLAIWGLYESWQTFSAGGQNGFNILPMAVLVVVVCIQGFSEMVMKRKMTSDDEEYKEPNKIAQTLIAVFVIAAVVVSFGSFIVLKLNEAVY
jgi:multisubunit Na+/H+ antiporter MnhC subunit